MFLDSISKNFIGEIPDSNYIFLAKPPVELGKVIMGHSTIKSGKKIPSSNEQMIQTILWGLVGVAIAVAIIYFAGLYKIGWRIFWLLLLGLGGAAVRFSMFNYVNYYLGELGLAKITMKSEDEVKKEAILLFKDAAYMVKGLTDRYKNFVYQGTDFSFEWHDANGEKLYTISGTYQSKEGTPKYGASYEFYWGVEAEKIWTERIYQQAVSEIKTMGYYEFGSSYGEKFRLGFGFIEKISSKGISVRINESEIKESYAKKGTLYIKTFTGSSWFHKGDAIELEFNNIHNSKVFLSLYYQMIKVGISTDK